MSRPLGVLLLIAATGGGAAASAGALELTSTLTHLLGADDAGRFDALYPAEATVRWEVFVPERYDAADPPGLLVYISPTADGRVPERWKAVLEAHNLIWVGADDAGNAVQVQRRALFALLSIPLIEDRYVLDRDRLYVTGLSGGGKMASMVATDHAHLFKGAIFICGVEFWDSLPPRIETIRQNRYVFLAGEHDQALRPTRRVFGRYMKAGVPGVKLVVVDGMGHENPEPAVLSEAISFLDAGPDG